MSFALTLSRRFLRSVTRACNRVIFICGMWSMLSVSAWSSPKIVDFDPSTLMSPKLDVEYAQPIISVDEVINPKSSMEGDYPEHSSGVYGGPFFWLDNHRIIFTALKDNKPGNKTVINVWDTEKETLAFFRPGSIDCYSNGVTRSYIKLNPQDEKYVPSVGPFSREVPATDQASRHSTDQPPRHYVHNDECTSEPISFVKEYMDAHPEEIMGALRQGHGLLVFAKREKWGQTYRRLEQDSVIFRAPGREPQTIPMIPWFESSAPPYYPFADAYAFFNHMHGDKHKGWGGRLLYRKNSKGETESFTWDSRTRLTDSTFILAVDGSIYKVKVPDFFLNGYGAGGPYLTRRGLLWVVSNVEPNPDHGFYLSRDEMVKKIFSGSISDFAKVSPDGCHVAYLDVPRNYGQYEGTLKSIDLCKGE